MILSSSLKSSLGIQRMGNERPTIKLKRKNASIVIEDETTDMQNKLLLPNDKVIRSPSEKIIK